MLLPGSWISATYLFKNKFNSLDTLLNSAEYAKTKERVFLFPCQKAGVLNVTITSQVAVYTLAERAKKFKFLLYPCLL